MLSLRAVGSVQSSCNGEGIGDWGSACESTVWIPSMTPLQVLARQGTKMIILLTDSTPLRIRLLVHIFGSLRLGFTCSPSLTNHG